MKRLLLVAVLVLLAVPCYAQQSLTITLTAKQVDALQVKFGADVDLTAKTQAWVNDWMVQFVRERDENAKRLLREALDKATPTTQAQIQTLLGVSVKPAVTVEEQAAYKAQVAADAAARVVEVNKVTAEKQMALAAAAKDKTDALAAADKAKTDALTAAQQQAVTDKQAALDKQKADILAACQSLKTMDCAKLIPVVPVIR